MSRRKGEDRERERKREGEGEKGERGERDFYILLKRI